MALTMMLRSARPRARLRVRSRGAPLVALQTSMGLRELSMRPNIEVVLTMRPYLLGF